MSCTYCRARHYKCDENLPKCKKCESAGRRCVREPPRRFRHFNAPKQRNQKQIWLPIPPKVDFVDETNSVIDGAGEVESDQDEESAPPHEAALFSHAHALEEVSRASFVNTHASPTFSAPVFGQDYASPAAISCYRTSISVAASSPTYAALRELGHSHHRVASEPTISIAPSPSQSCLNNDQWPLKSEEEAMLLRFYLDHVSTFFDLCEPYPYFKLEVPQRARTNKTLANAILAISARMMHWKTGYNPYVADRYYQLCLETLIPSLDDVEAVMDETLLAATVVLRMLEEMDVHISGSDTQGHLTGSQALINASSTHGAPTGLRRAAYWSAFRQEVWIAPQTAQPVASSIMAPAAYGLVFDSGFGPAPGWVWCQRAIAHCGAVMESTIAMARGGGRDEAVKGWTALCGENERWFASVPAEFEPWFGAWDQRGEGDIFPVVRFLASWHVMGYSYMIEAHLLLMVYDPTIPKLGPLRRRAVAEMDEKAMEDVRKLCGLARSNEASPAASLIACMAIALCGDRFIHFADQHRLHEFLYETEKRHGWPTAKARSQLEEAWSWQPNIRHTDTPVTHSVGAAMTPP